MARGPILFYGAIALVVLGVILLVVWLMGPEQPLGAMFATDTPTVTVTATATSTNTPTATATITETATITLTPTPSEDYPYTLIEGDTLQGIAEKFDLGPEGVLLLLEKNPDIVAAGGLYFVGQTITIPKPGSVLSTPTPLPANIGRGTRIDYKVLPGDTLAAIAVKFNSLEEEIVKANNIEDANALFVGQDLKIPVNLVTATATLPATSTPVTPTVEGQPTQAVATTPAPPATGGSVACTPIQNEGFVAELLTLINNARTSSGLPALNVNQNLASAANAHATDMLCNNYFSPIGLDGSTVQSRIAKQGYSASIVLENLYALQPAFGMSPQVAFNWWNQNAASRDNMLNPGVTEIGIAYVSDENTLFGAYFVVTFGKP